jgi:hypothetical protein
MGKLRQRAGRSHESKSNQHPARPKRSNATTDRRASYSVEHAIDTLGLQGTYETIDRTGPNRVHDTGDLVPRRQR